MARQPTQLEVTAQGEKWIVRELGIGRLTSHTNQDDAAKAARAVALNNTPSELTIRKADGTVEREEKFPRLPTGAIARK